MPTVFRFLAESNRYAIISYGSSNDLYLIVITWEKFKEVYAAVDSETAVWETLSFRQCHSARLKMKAYLLESVQLHPSHASFSVICQSFARVRNINARLQQSYSTLTVSYHDEGREKEDGSTNFDNEDASERQSENKPCHFFFRWQTWGRKMLSVRKIALYRLESNRALISRNVVRNIWKVLNSSPYDNGIKNILKWTSFAHIH